MQVHFLFEVYRNCYQNQYNMTSSYRVYLLPHEWTVPNIPTTSSILFNNIYTAVESKTRTEGKKLILAIHGLGINLTAGWLVLGSQPGTDSNPEQMIKSLSSRCKPTSKQSNFNLHSWTHFSYLRFLGPDHHT